MEKEIEQILNRHCAENGSDTPDFILAKYLIDCLSAYNTALVSREKWYGRKVGSWNTEKCSCDGVESVCSNCKYYGK